MLNILRYLQLANGNLDVDRFKGDSSQVWSHPRYPKGKKKKENKTQSIYFAFSFSNGSIWVWREAQILLMFQILKDLKLRLAQLF